MNEPARRPPFLGTLSILLPAFGAALWLLVAKHPHVGDKWNGFAGLVIFFGLVGLSAALVLGGVTCGVMGLIRRERWRFLAMLGLLLNFGIIVCFRR